MLKRLKAWCWNSATIAWGYAQVFGSFVLLGLTQFGDLINSTDVKSAIAGLGLNPKVMLILAVIGTVLGPTGLITIAARMRTVNKPTDENNQVVE